MSMCEVDDPCDVFDVVQQSEEQARLRTLVNPQLPSIPKTLRP